MRIRSSPSLVYNILSDIESIRLTTADELVSRLKVTSSKDIHSMFNVAVLVGSPFNFPSLEKIYQGLEEGKMSGNIIYACEKIVSLRECGVSAMNGM